MRPSLGLRKPEMIENSVVLPAPLGPIRAVMAPVSATNDALSTASKPPKRFETFATRSSGSATAALQQTGDAARREGDHQDQHAAVDDEVEPRCVAGDE